MVLSIAPFSRSPQFWGILLTPAPPPRRPLPVHCRPPDHHSPQRPERPSTARLRLPTPKGLDSMWSRSPKRLAFWFRLFARPRPELAVGLPQIADFMFNGPVLIKRNVFAAAGRHIPKHQNITFDKAFGIIATDPQRTSAWCVGIGGAQGHCHGHRPAGGAPAPTKTGESKPDSPGRRGGGCPGLGGGGQPGQPGPMAGPGWPPHPSAASSVLQHHRCTPTAQGMGCGGAHKQLPARDGILTPAGEHTQSDGSLTPPPPPGGREI